MKNILTLNTVIDLFSSYSPEIVRHAYMTNHYARCERDVSVDRKSQLARIKEASTINGRTKNHHSDIGIAALLEHFEVSRKGVVVNFDNPQRHI